MRLVVTGGTGFIGGDLREALLRHGHTLSVVTRATASRAAQPGCRYISWDADAWRSAVEEADGVINLAGEPIASGRWSEERKRLIRASRVETTHRVVEAMAAVSRRPSVLVSASAIGYYGPHGSEELTESDPPGAGFLAETCQAWEGEALRAEALGVRVVCLRIGLVLGPDGGVLSKMLAPFRAFLGGPVGSGRQWVSWIHRDDVIGLAEWSLEHASVSGAVNATAPTPLTMEEFARELARALRRPCFALVPSIVARALLGEMAQLVLTGQRVTPQAAQHGGYTFRYPGLAEALRACVGRTG